MNFMFQVLKKKFLIFKNFAFNFLSLGPNLNPTLPGGERTILPLPYLKAFRNAEEL